MAEESASHWVVYAKHADYPTKFIARRWLITQPLTLTNDILIADDLESLRVKIPQGLFRIPASPLDQPEIVETWI